MLRCQRLSFRDRMRHWHNRNMRESETKCQRLSFRDRMRHKGENREKSNAITVSETFI